MNKIATNDGFLARNPSGEGYSMAFDRQSIGGDEAVEALNVSPETNDPAAVPSGLVVGRSGIGIMPRIDIKRSLDQPIVEIGDEVLVPIELEHHSKLGKRVICHFGKLSKNHDPGESLRWNGSRIALGRVIWRGDLVQLQDEELERGHAEGLFAYGRLFEGKFQGDLRIENDAVNMPIESHELEPDFNMLNGGDAEYLQPMFEEGSSARRFVFDRIKAAWRPENYLMPNCTVSSVLFAPGPFICQVVRAYSPDGSMPHIDAAAWLDPNRFQGLHNEHRLGFEGRQFEVYKTDPTSSQRWGDTRLEIKLFRHASEELTKALMQMWETSFQDRVGLHYVGYGNGV
jgi:hypothetical protein